MCKTSIRSIPALFLVVEMVVVEFLVSETKVVRAVERKPAVTKPIIAWVPVVKAKVRLVWISVHEPVPFEVVEVVHAERTTSCKAPSAKEPVVVFSVVEVAVVALVVEAFVVVPSERQRPAPTAELLTVGSS